MRTRVTTRSLGRCLLWTLGLWVCGAGVARAQALAPEVLWERVVGGPCAEWAYAVEEAPDGGYLAAGMRFEADHVLAVDLYLVRVDAEGEVIWELAYGAPIGAEHALDIVLTSEGTYLVTGATGGEWNCSTECENAPWDVWLLRVDDAGSVVWDRRYGGFGADSGHALVETRDGGVAIAGITTSTGAGLADVLLMKIDRRGRLEWERSYGRPNHNRAYALAETEDGGFVLAGRESDESDDVLVVRVDEEGELLWERGLGGLYNDLARSVVASRDGSFVVAGALQSRRADGSVERDVYVVKLDGEGNTVWESVVARPNNESARSIVQLEDGGFVVAGSAAVINERRSYLLKLDANGTVVWERFIDGPGKNSSSDVIVTRDGGFVLAGRAAPPVPPGSVVCMPEELYLVKLGPERRAAPFRRGDADGNERVELNDAIVVLGHLFRGASALGCPDAGDADDSGEVNITDAIAILGYLFLGRGAPPAPGPADPGPDPTLDELVCLDS